MYQYNGSEQEMYELAQEWGEIRAVTRMSNVSWFGVAYSYIEFCHFEIVDRGDVIGQLKEGTDGWYLFIDLDSLPVNTETLKIVQQAREQVLRTL